MTQDDKVFLAGDWHGNTNWVNARLQQIADIHGPGATVLHLGDFGVWPGSRGRQYLTSVEKVCARNDITILVTPGNHEDWDQIHRLWDTGTDQLRDHIRILARGQRFTLGERSFVSLGGAPSMDRHLRQQQVNWWPQEELTDGDVGFTLALGHADVMLTHDSPDDPWAVPAVSAICSRPGSWPVSALLRAEVGRKHVSRAFEGVAPRLLAHGHYHVADDRTVQLDGVKHTTRVVALAGDEADGNMLQLNLDDLSVSLVTLRS